jgi:STE24 endopeptidase
MRSAALIAALLALIVVPLLLAKPPASAPSPTEYFSLEQIARADQYSALRLPVGLASLGLSLAVGVILAIGPAARALGSWAQRVSGNRWPLTTLLLAAIVALVPLLAQLPLTLIRHRIDRDFGLATGSVGQLLSDVARAAGFGVVLSLLAGFGFVALANALPRLWPWAVAGAGSVMLVGLVFLLPVVYEPMFNKFAAVSEPTRSRVLNLAQQAGVPVSEVLVSDASKRTSRHNAYVSGLGATRRVVLYDTLLNGAPEKEVDLVVAHELAHVAHKDVRNATALGILGLIAGVAVLAMLLKSPTILGMTGATSSSDPRIVPFLAAFVLVSGFATTPLQTLISRQAEASADRFAIEVTGDPQTAVSVEQRLALTNLADLTPISVLHEFFGTHPTTMERIGIALEMGAARPSTVEP